MSVIDNDLLIVLFVVSGNDTEEEQEDKGKVYDVANVWCTLFQVNQKRQNEKVN